MRRDNRAWFGVLPVLLIVAFSAVVPLMTVVNYSVQDILDINTRLFVGFDWYRETLHDPRLQDALGRQLLFSALVILIEIPLGIAIALALPREGRMILFPPWYVHYVHPFRGGGERAIIAFDILAQKPGPNFVF